MNRSSTVLLGAIVAVATVVAIGFAREPFSDEADHAMPPAGASSEGARISLVAGSVRMEVTDRTYIAVRGKRLITLGEPALVGGRQITVPVVDKNPKGLGRAVLYQVDRNGIISDVMVLSRTRDDNKRLVPLQWLATKSGVEFVWPVAGKRPWTVKRAGKVVEEQAHGHYVDSRLVNSPTRYEVTRSVPTTVTYRGKTTTEESSTTYVLIVPAYDDDLIGQPFDQAVGDKPAPPNPLQTASVGEDVEIARFLE